MKYLLLICSLGLTMNLSIADDPSLIINSPEQMVCKVIQDPKTKVVFYLESDRHHLSAISPQGTLLWQIDTWANLSQQITTSTSLETLRNANLINFIDLYKSEGGFTITEAQWSGLHLGNKDDYLSESLNDSAVGLVKKSTGKFILLRRN